MSREDSRTDLDAQGDAPASPGVPQHGPRGTSPSPGASWTFLTNHAHVLVCIARDPGIRIREIAERVGITERAAQGIVADLAAAGYVTRTRIGRRNRYEIDPTRPVRHPLEQPHSIGDLLSAIAAIENRAGASAPEPAAPPGAERRPPATRPSQPSADGDPSRRDR